MTEEHSLVAEPIPGVIANAGLCEGRERTGAATTVLARIVRIDAERHLVWLGRSDRSG